MKENANQLLAYQNFLKVEMFFIVKGHIAARWAF